MRGKFKKFVSYLLVTTIIAPLWFVSGALGASKAKAWNDEIIIDNSDAGSGYEASAGWSSFSNPSGYGGNFDYKVPPISNPLLTAKWVPSDKKSTMTAGEYAVYAHWSVHSARPTAIDYQIKDSNGVFDSATVNQTQKADGSTPENFTASGWALLGTYYFDAVTPGYVSLTEVENGHACADAVKFSHSDVKPETPSLISPKDKAYVGNADVVLDWSDSARNDDPVLKYDLQVSSNADFSLPIVALSKTSINDSMATVAVGGISDGELFWRIRAVDDYGYSAWSTSYSLIKDTVSPGVPTGFIANYANGSVTLLWDTVAEAYSYDIHRYSSPDAVIGTVFSPVTSFVDNSPVMAENHYYVVAKDQAGNKSGSSNEYIIDLSQLSAPANLVSSVGGGGDITLTWSAVSGVDHYNVYYQKYSDVSYTGPVSTTLTTATITGLQSGENYRFIVRAVGKNGTESTDAWLQVLSPASKKVVIATVKPQTAQASETVTTKPVETQPTTIEEPVTDGEIEDGEIKGDETTATEETEEINWTPWIILFILIILAGAATGGYFYWFAGDEDALIEATEKPEKIVKKSVSADKGQKSSKKPRRW